MNVFAPWIKATLSMMGTIMGAGLFALPYAFSQIGLGWGTLVFAFLAIGMTITHLGYMDEILSETGHHRLTYFIKQRFGVRASFLPMITYPVQLFSINYAYLLLGGAFLGMMAHRFGISMNETLWIVVFWIFFSIIALLGISIVAKAEVYITSALIVTLIFMGIVQLPAVTTFTVPMGDADLLLALGVFLFSASGISGIGEIVQIAKTRQMAKRAIVLGTVGSAILSWFFGVIFYLASRGEISSRIIDFQSYIPDAFFWLLPLLGLTGIASSYLTASVELATVLEKDFRWHKFQALAVTYLLPIACLAFVTRAFVEVISFAGSVFIGINAAMVCFLALVRSRQNTFTKNTVVRVSVYGVLATIYLLSALIALAKPWR